MNPCQEYRTGDARVRTSVDMDRNISPCVSMNTFQGPIKQKISRRCHKNTWLSNCVDSVDNNPPLTHFKASVWSYDYSANTRKEAISPPRAFDVSAHVDNPAYGLHMNNLHA